MKVNNNGLMDSHLEGMDDMTWNRPNKSNVKTGNRWKLVDEMKWRVMKLGDQDEWGNENPRNDRDELNMKNMTLNNRANPI